MILTLHAVSLTISTVSLLEICENRSKRKMCTSQKQREFFVSITSSTRFLNLFGVISSYIKKLFNGFTFHITYPCQFSPRTNSPSRLDFSNCSNPRHLLFLQLSVGHKWNVSPILQITYGRIVAFSLAFFSSWVVVFNSEETSFILVKFRANILPRKHEVINFLIRSPPYLWHD